MSVRRWWDALRSGLRARTRRSRIVLSSLAAVLVAVAVTLIVIGVTGQKHAPQPPAAAAIPLPSAASTAAPSPRATRAPSSSTAPSSPLPTGVGSNPIQITIPAIHVQANMMLLGLNADRTVQVPPLSMVGTAGWYDQSPTPGATGPSVILGHIDSAVYGDGVFYNLGDVRQGDSVSVLRADHMRADFRVDRVIEAPKTNFPTQEVYGNTSNAQVRLITCGGAFDSSARSYLDNIIVFGTLTSLKHT